MRYKNQRKATIRSKDYEILETKHNREETIITRTIDFGALKGQQISLSFRGKWKQGDSLIKIADEVYGNTSLWWVIGLVNNKPTDQHFNIGDDVFIPNQPSIILNLIGE